MNAQFSIQSAELKLTFDPVQGGKWISLFDLRNGEEWFWCNPHIARVPIQFGDSYIEKHDTGGWDEIFPSVSPCGAIPDHGDLVQLPWSVVDYCDSEITMSVRRRSSPFVFQRKISLVGERIQCRYRVENLGDKEIPWLWCPHPALPFSDGLKLEVETAFEVVFAMGSAEGFVGHRVCWEDLQALPRPWAAKIFTDRHAIRSVDVVRPGAGRLRFSWDERQIPYLGIWANCGAWSGAGTEPYSNIIVEPTMLPMDDLSKAVAPPLLAPHGLVEWMMEVTVDRDGGL